MGQFFKVVLLKYLDCTLRIFELYSPKLMYNVIYQHEEPYTYVSLKIWIHGVTHFGDRSIGISETIRDTKIFKRGKF